MSSIGTLERFRGFAEWQGDTGAHRPADDRGQGYLAELQEGGDHCGDRERLVECIEHVLVGWILVLAGEIPWCRRVPAESRRKSDRELFRSPLDVFRVASLHGRSVFLVNENSGRGHPANVGYAFDDTTPR